MNSTSGFDEFGSHRDNSNHAVIFTMNLMIVFILTLSGCKKISVQKNGTSVMSHSSFDTLLSLHVDSVGLVNYQSLVKDSASLNGYIRTLQDHIPNDSNWTREDKIAYWINLYNAYTLKLIVDHYPIESIKKVSHGPQIPFVNSPWDIKFIKLNEQSYDLNNIEHNILRKFDEPRIHFAIVCASRSCPNLRREAYIGSKLNAQLTDQTVGFLTDKSRNIVSDNNVKLSKIFQWFKSDFTKNGSVIDFINSQLNTNLPKDTSVDYISYDWSLNVQ